MTNYKIPLITPQSSFNKCLRCSRYQISCWVLDTQIKDVPVLTLLPFQSVIPLNGTCVSCSICHSGFFSSFDFQIKRSDFRHLSSVKHFLHVGKAKGPQQHTRLGQELCDTAAQPDASAGALPHSGQSTYPLCFSLCISTVRTNNCARCIVSAQ